MEENLLPRNEEDYLETRVLTQIEWYDKKSKVNKNWFLRLKTSEISLALLVPFLSGYIESSTPSLKIAVGIIGIIVAAIAGLITLIKFQENWIDYRTTAESLKLEKYLFLAKAGPYKEVEEPFSFFVERFESLISTSTKKWFDYVSKTDNDKRQEIGK